MTRRGPGTWAPSGTFVTAVRGSDARLRNNLFVGPGGLTSGPVRARTNLRVGLGSFVGPGREDFRLEASSRAVDRGSAVPRRWRARWEYVAPAARVRRPSVGRTDLGAFERR